MDFNTHDTQYHNSTNHLGYPTPSPDSPKEVKMHNEVIIGYPNIEKQDNMSNNSPKNNDDLERPSHSYIALISMAILSKPDKKILLNEIYDWVVNNFQYYQSRTDKSWRNSIRHNLSLNECFIKVGKAGNGRGYYWSIHPSNMGDFKKGDFRRRHSRLRAKADRGGIRPAKIPPNESFLSSPNVNLLLPSQPTNSHEEPAQNQTFFNNHSPSSPTPSHPPPTTTSYYYNNSQICSQPMNHHQFNDQFHQNVDITHQMYHQSNLSSPSQHQYNYMTANFSWLPAAAAAAHNNFLESLTSSALSYNPIIQNTYQCSNDNEILSIYHPCHSFNSK